MRLQSFIKTGTENVRYKGEGNGKETGENFAVRNLVIFTFHQTLLDCTNQKQCDCQSMKRS